jgi:hypothetical protein
MKKILLAFLFLVAGCVGFAQPNLTRLDKNSIPRAIKYPGHVIDAVRWTDSLGDNIVITTETGITPGKSEGSSDAALYAYHYLAGADSFRLVWRIYDFIKDCDVDLEANYVKGAFAVTDLNKDGTAEVWVMYRTVCHGDVSPSNMKIIMYEGNKKYAVRGTSRVKPAANEVDGGEYNFDDAFKHGPEVFRQYATQLWNKNIDETWE